GKVVSIPTDPFGHGTLVAGIIGAGIEGTTGVSGVCWDVQLVSLRIFDDDGEGYSSYAVNAIDYATAKNIPLLNLSACWYEDWENYDSPMNIVISNYPGLLICAAGNYESNNDNGNIYPASLNLPNVITVANSTAADVLLANVYDAYGNPRGSNYGASTVHLAAPGTGIKCCYPGNNYGTTDGTSLSAPYVTGVAALIMSIRPDLSATEVKKLILDNVDHVEALEGKCITGGRLNAYKAVLAATQSQTLTGDVNGDNRADMILSRNINGKRALTVFLGKADGSFTEPITTNSTRTFIYYDPAFTGDFDGDGLTDVVFHWRDYDTHKRRFIVYRSKGDGTFYDAVQLSCTLTHEPQQYPCTFHVDDVDGDGQDDFIIVQKNTSGNYGAWVYRGTSQSPYLINTTTCELSSNKAYSTANTVHTGDFNGDGRADILVQRSSSTNTNVSGMRQLIVYLGNTDGSFNEGSMLTSVRAFDLATYPSQFFVSDMNGDGKDDFVVHWKNDSGKRTNIVYKGASYASYLVDSSTNALATFHTYSEENPVYVGDVNGDGREDMIVHWSSEGKRQLWVYPANADGTYSSGSNTATVNAYNPALYADEYFVEDVNGDGREDFIVKWKNTDGRVSFVTYLGTTSGTFTAAVRTEPVANIPYYNFGNTYRITNAGAVKCLNVYGDNVTTINNNQNVCVWTNSGTLEQRWVIGFIGDGTYIRSAIDTDFGLHASGTGSPWNCDLYQIAGNEAYTQVDFIATSGGAYRIKLHNYDLYLTASSTEEGANVYWTSFIATERQAWYVTCV
ncbi:MAG: VCBS repeat-containing protein, partial [Clostridia bacterium]|nr:VCBS repeat-containing protein [Clostridia bacterium]